MRPKAHIAPPPVGPRIRGARRRVIYRRHRLHPQHIVQRGREKRCKERRLERQHLPPVRAGPFGKEQQPLARHQSFFEQLCLHPGLPRIARDEQRARRPCKRSDARPARHLGFRHEVHPVGGVEHKDVEPAGMVRDHRAPVLHGVAPAVKAQAHPDQAHTAHALSDPRRPGPVQTKDRTFDQPQRQQQRKAQQDRHDDQCGPARNPQPAARAGRGRLGRRRAVPGHAHVAPP